MRRMPFMGVAFLAAGLLMGCGGVEAAEGEAPGPVVSEEEQSLAPSCAAGETEVYLWHCRRLAAHAPPCNYGGPGHYNVLHLFCESGTTFYDAGPTGDYACGDCF